MSAGRATRSMIGCSPLGRWRWRLVMIALPLVFTQSFALSMLCQMGIAIIFALSYNMLLGQTGLLSFGHAVYFGLGASSARTP